MNKKINVLFPVGSLYPDESGGVSISLYWLLRGLYTSKYVDVTTITTTTGIVSPKIPFNKWLFTEYGKVIYLSVFRHKLAFGLIYTFFKEVKKHDVVHLSSIFYPPSIICFFISLLFKKKTIWSIHGSLDDVEFKKRRNSKLLVLYFLNFFIKDTCLHVTSDQELDYVKKRLSKAVKFTNVTNYMILPEKVTYEKENYFLYIGRFHQKKGIENLLYGLNNSKLFLESNYILKLAGDYNNIYGATIKQLVNDLNLSHKIQFLGHIQGNDKISLLSNAYCMILPSFSENFGIVVTESLSLSTPVISSIYTPWEFLNTYKAGYWIDNTPEEICKAINDILCLPREKFLLMCDNSYKLVNNEFNIFNKLYIWEQTYQGL